MTLFHKKDGGTIVSSGKGDYGICTICNERVDHLIWDGTMKDGAPMPSINKEVEIHDY